MWGTRSNNFKITERRNRVNTEIPLETSISAIRHVLEDGGRPDTSDATAAKARTGMVLAPMSEDLTTLLARRVMGWNVAPERFLNGKTTMDAALGPTATDAKRSREQMIATIANRRVAVCRIVAERGSVPSLRVMARLLAASGFRASRFTVSTDYCALSLESNARTERTVRSACL